MVPPTVDVRGLRMADWRLESSSSTRRRPLTSPSGMAVGGPDGSVLACVGRARGAQARGVTGHWLRRHRIRCARFLVAYRPL